jgi:glycosyltransferase involved in cell wall biosynthesis
MMPSVVVSVVIPCYNEEKNIGKCLETILHQTLENFEVLLVDDGSTDQTKEIIRRYPVRLLEHNHKGPGAARNWGAKEALGEILVFVDADMFFDKGFLEHLVAPIRQGIAIGSFNKDELVGNPENQWAVCWNLESNGTRERRIPVDHPDESIIYRALLRARFLEVGGFETAVGYEDDATLFPKLGVKAYYAPGAICYHNNPGSLNEIYQSARWIGRSSRFSDHPERLLKFLPPVTLLVALKKSLEFSIAAFFPFKIVYDWGILAGGLSRLLLHKHSK